MNQEIKRCSSQASKITWDEFTDRLARHIRTLHCRPAGSKACQAEIHRWIKELESLSQPNADIRPKGARPA